MRRMALGCVLALGACAFVPPVSDWKRCRFEIGGIRFQGIRENQSEWKVDLDVHNPNSRRLKLQGLELFALSGGDTLAALNAPMPLELAPGDTTRIPLDARLPHAAWRSVMGAMSGTGNGSITLVGDATYNGWLGTRKIRGAFRKTYEVDFPALMKAAGGNLFQGLLPFP